MPNVKRSPPPPLLAHAIVPTPPPPQTSSPPAVAKKTQTPTPPTTSDLTGILQRATRAKSKMKQNKVVQHIDSETALTSEDDDRSARSECDGAKRKHGHIDNSNDDGNMQSAVAEMRILFANMSTKNETQFNLLHSSMGSIQTEVSEIGKAVDYLAQKNEEFQNKLIKFESEKKEDRKYLESMDAKLETVERKARNSCIELRNVDKISQSETKADLCNLMINLGSALNLTIQEHDIRDIYRMKPRKEAQGTIIVEFCSVIRKDAVINSIRKLNYGQKKEDRLNSRHLNLGGPPKPVFVSECLTQKAKRLLFMARDFAKSNSYRFCWSTNGCIYLRRADNQPIIRVFDEDMLSRLQEVK